MWKFVKSYLPFVSSPYEDVEVSEEEANAVLEELMTESDNETSLSQNADDREEIDLVGIITKASDNWVLIDDIYDYHFTPTPGKNFAVNDSVRYTLCISGDERVIDNVEVITKTDEIIEDSPQDEPFGEITTLYGQVFDRKQREFLVHIDENNRISFNLNDVKSEFIPRLGDFIDLDVVKSTKVETECSKEHVKVLKIRPRKTAMKLGTITAWDGRYGTISDFAFFTLDSCEQGFVPGPGFKVCASIIRSDCPDGAQWRAINVIPDIVSNNTASKRDKKLVEEEMRNKRGVLVSVSPKQTLYLHDDLTFRVQVSNKSSSEKTTRVKSCSQDDSLQVKLASPGYNSISIKSGEVVDFVFKIFGKYIGRSAESFIWDFGDFVIRRIFTFEVLLPPDKSCEGLSSKPQGSLFKNSFSKVITASSIVNRREGNIIPGRNSSTGTCFVPVKIGPYKLPDILVEMVLPESKTPFKDLRFNVEKHCPFLDTGLTPATYTQYMHTLLFLEEIDQLKKIARLDIENASFRKYLSFLILQVPEYSAYTSNLVPGDYALIHCPWDNKNKMQGIIKKVTKSEIWMMFSASFHSSYIEGTYYYTSFVVSRTSLRRMHNAIDQSYKYLKPEWLFPEQVPDKPPQVEICESKESPSIPDQVETNDPVSSYMGRGRGKGFSRKPGYWNCEGAGYGRTVRVKEYTPKIKTEKTSEIKWFNKNLNKEQQNAVKRVLTGVARPLPYVIFGPPGTGKTVTLVEIILQVHALIPNSMILIGTPTNSAADLISYRLLESGNLAEGEFLRVVGYNYAEQGRIISSLIPYSAVATFSQGEDIEDMPENVRVFNRNQISEHRVVVGTLQSLGTLYAMGFPRGFFTHIFVDEAGQATEPELMLLMNFFSPLTGNVILSGDPLQLGPVLTSPLAITYGLQDSFLLRLLSRYPYLRDTNSFSENYGFDPRLVTKLVENYRSLNDILQIFNSLFYNGDLRANVSDTGSEEAILLKKMNSLNLNSAVLFHGVQGTSLQDSDSKSWYNPQEVFQVFCYVTKLYYDGVHPDLIGIITPYQSQVSKIQMMLESNNLETPKIGSVEEFQGQEKMVIILSLVRSTEDSDILHSSFVTNPRRVNVAISRARALLILIGDPRILSQNENWHKIIKYCVKKNSYVGCQVPDLETEVEEKS